MNIGEGTPPQSNSEHKLEQRPSNSEGNMKSPNESQNAKAEQEAEEELYEEDQLNQPLTRQDQYIQFTNDKDLRNPEQIVAKAALYKGISVKVKILNHIWIDNLLLAIESVKDHGIVNLRIEDCKIMKRAV